MAEMPLLAGRTGWLKGILRLLRTDSLRSPAGFAQDDNVFLLMAESSLLTAQIADSYFLANSLRWRL